MSHHVQERIPYTFTKSFWQKVLKNCIAELLVIWKVLVIFGMSLSVVWIFLRAFIPTFLDNFPPVKKVLVFFLFAIPLYIVGKYFTLLPMYIVFPLLFVPTKFSIPITVLSLIFSFFLIFLI